MKNGILMMMAVVFLGGCAAGPAPVWPTRIYSAPANQQAAHVLADDVSQADYSRKFYWSLADFTVK